MSDLVEMLRETYESVVTGNDVLRNPDGPEAAARIEQLEAALRRIDRMEVYEADAHVVLWGKIGIMRDIARAALGEKETRDDE